MRRSGSTRVRPAGRGDQVWIQEISSVDTRLDGAPELATRRGWRKLGMMPVGTEMVKSGSVVTSRRTTPLETRNGCSKTSAVARGRFVFLLANGFNLPPTVWTDPELKET